MNWTLPDVRALSRFEHSLLVEYLNTPPDPIAGLPDEDEHF